jgi:hypothetical protein
VSKNETKWTRSQPFWRATITTTSGFLVIPIARTLQLRNRLFHVLKFTFDPGSIIDPSVCGHLLCPCSEKLNDVRGRVKKKFPRQAVAQMSLRVLTSIAVQLVLDAAPSSFTMRAHRAEKRISAGTVLGVTG